VSRKIKPVVLYGQFHGNWSNAGVSRGLAAGLHANGVPLRLVSEFGMFDGLYTLPQRKRQRLPEFMEMPMAQSQGTGMFVGYSIRSLQYLNMHLVKVGAFIAESSTLPGDWLVAANMCRLVVCPSRWTANAYGGTALVVKHGLHPCYAQPLPPAKPNGLAFLHIAGARDFLERKGTPQLISAFAKAFHPTNGLLKDSKALLVIRTPESSKIQELVAHTGVPHLFHIDTHEEALDPPHMRAYYDKGWAAVVQPSRAEAFGLVPLEARACGIPVILTDAHGHREHVESSDVLIGVGPSAPIAVNGIPNGMAPTVSVDSVLGALVKFVQNVGIVTERARATALGYYEKYQWGKLCEPLAMKLREIQ
jgi:hypothetical protein